MVTFPWSLRQECAYVCETLNTLAKIDVEKGRFPLYPLAHITPPPASLPCNALERQANFMAFIYTHNTAHTVKPQCKMKFQM